jgi:hypothetical protein
LDEVRQVHDVCYIETQARKSWPGLGLGSKPIFTFEKLLGFDEQESRQFVFPARQTALLKDTKNLGVVAEGCWSCTRQFTDLTCAVFVGLCDRGHHQVVPIH